VTDLTARVAELAASIETGLAEDEVAAKRASRDKQAGDAWHAGDGGDGWTQAGTPVHRPDGGPLAIAIGDYAAIHIARNDPGRRLRDVKAARDLVTAILAERHDYNDGDPWFSCSQATVPGDDGEPGSGCANDERAGKPCDCGRDARVARMLGIIAAEWETA
jgi:hypothetical protein